MVSIFRFSDREIIKKCGLDAYFFLRYLQTLLVIFVPLACLILPILLPLNYSGGNGTNTAVPDSTVMSNVTGLDTLAWSNVKPANANRYWAHLVLSLIVIVWVCYVFWNELGIYIRIRQDYLTSAEHRLRASATTILISTIPSKWLTHKALTDLFDVYPGGIRNIWLNRNYDLLLDKISERDSVHKKLEAAETDLIKMAKKAHKKAVDAEKKKVAKQQGQKAKTKQERAAEEKADAQAAEQAARQTDGLSSGDQKVQRTVEDAVEDVDEYEDEKVVEGGVGLKKPFTLLNSGIKGIGQGLNKGFGLVGKAGDEVFEGGQKLVRGVDDQLGTTNGFMDATDPNRRSQIYSSYGDDSATQNSAHASKLDEKRKTYYVASETDATRNSSGNSQAPITAGQHKNAQDFGSMRPNQTTGHHPSWHVWRVPAGGFPSPEPAHEDGDEFPLMGDSDQNSTNASKAAEMSTWQKFKSKIPFVGGEDIESIDYPNPYNEEYEEDAPGGAAWEKYVKQKDRPTHRLKLFSWMPFSLPFIGESVDTIYHCREHLARLNVEIEEDQKHPERFPLMNSAFIQFNHQVAAHMAAQSVTHHVAARMSPRSVEISPNGILWQNMAISWWEGTLRSVVCFTIAVAMAALWAFPVAFSASFASLTSLIQRFPFLSFLQNNKVVANAIAGVLPPIILALVLAVVPFIFYRLSRFSGVRTRNEMELRVQTWYFAFLFIQVFLVVSVSSAAFKTLQTNFSNVGSYPTILAQNIPKAANYFFSYMIIQALSTSASTLLQIGTLIMWFILPKLFDSTARQKWKRNTTLPGVAWGTFFPVYTNFACITIIYSVVSPLILLFGIITFSLLFLANRYNMLYVTQFRSDTGGLVYPKAINQTFTGLYIMEVCLIGLFFLVRDAGNNAACIPQAIIMIVALILTAAFQFYMNYIHSPLFNHLPITFEDDAVIRDKAFEQDQARRLNLVGRGDSEAEELAEEELAQKIHGNTYSEDVELKPITTTSTNPGVGGDATQTNQDKQRARFDPRRVGQGALGAGNWAARNAGNLAGGIANLAFGQDDNFATTTNMRNRRHRDLESQKRIGAALFSGYADEIEDLTPEERDVLVKKAFQHIALRSRRPAVWIPRDDLGVADDEIRRTNEFAGKNIWISNAGTSLDGKARVVYGRNPPDFSEIELIQL